MSPIKAYHRPKYLDDALRLLDRPGTMVIGGGTHALSHLSDTITEIIDLQAISGLDRIDYTGHGLNLGSLVRLQSLYEDGQAPYLLRHAIRHEAPLNFRNAATIGGLIAGPDKESEVLAALLVFDAQVQVHSGSGSRSLSLTQFLQDVTAGLGGGLITGVSLSTLGRTASDRVARTPMDRPIVAALGRRGYDEKIRLALCGVANVPVLVDPDNVKAAINPPHDFRGSREYRRQMAATLARRVVSRLNSEE